ncbi:hypothetical protein [Streptomyces sp. MH60]|uniref:hypothetical protein n=1 Tax=Streptomyces sp. MH60 TaxID=1940758 RepID=UPI000CEDE0A4|nr:hypothetical protein [Streptomyces sp. MH60]PPS89426.1 hypothetical protein BZZ08_01572 [Streptomyces sp. MH60]
MATRPAPPSMPAPIRQMLIHADPVSGRVIGASAQFPLMMTRRYVTQRGSGYYLTRHGRRVRDQVIATRREVTVEGLPFRVIDHITELYLSGKSIQEITQRTRASEKAVLAALEFRKVLA